MKQIQPHLKTPVRSSYFERRSILYTFYSEICNPVYSTAGIGLAGSERLKIVQNSASCCL